MPLYSYKAIDKNNKIVEETMQAPSRPDVASMLKSEGLSLLTVKNLETGTRIIFRGKVSVSEKAIFCRFMGTMLRSGLSLYEAVKILSNESKNKKMQKILSDIAFQTKKGKSLSSILSRYEDIFDPVFLTMVKAGEESGTLDKSFDYLSKQLMAKHRLSQKIKGTLMYPAVIITAMLGVGLLMVLFVLPQISKVFLKMNVELPFMTKLILDFGMFAGEHSILLIAGIAGFAILLFILFSTKAFKKLFLELIGKIPVVHDVIMQVDVAQFARTLSTLLRSGVPITDALNVSANSLNQPGLKSYAKGFSKGILKGETLSDVLAEKKESFPAIMVQTIKTGEKTGTLDKVLQELADFYEEESEQKLKGLTSLVEPVIMLLIGIAVGAMVVMIIAPIYSIVGNLQQSM